MNFVKNPHDLKSIAKVHYGGVVDGTVSGQINPIYKDWSFTYDQWPQELKDEYNLTRPRPLMN